MERFQNVNGPETDVRSYSSSVWMAMFTVVILSLFCHWILSIWNIDSLSCSAYVSKSRPNLEITTYHSLVYKLLYITQESISTMSLIPHLNEN